MEKTLEEVSDEVKNLEIIKRLGVHPVTKYLNFFGEIILLDFSDSPDKEK